MDLTKIKENEILRIKGKDYEVIGIMKDFECLPPKYKLRKTLYFDLLEKGSKRITPTHYIVYYYDTKEISFSDNKLKETDIQIIF